MDLVEAFNPMRFLCRLVLLALLAWSCSASARVVPPIEIGGEGAIPVGQRFLLFRDASGNLPVDQVIAAAERGEFGTVPEGPLGRGVVDGATWLRMEFRNTLGAPVLRWLESTHLLQQYYDLYLLEPSGRMRGHFRSGAAVPVAQRDVPVRNVLLPVQMNPGETLVAYLRISGNGATRLDLKLWHPAAKIEKQRTDDAWTFLVLGLSLVVVFFSIQSFLIRKDLFLLACGVAQFLLVVVRALLQGHFVGLILQLEGMWLSRLTVIGILAALAMHALFARSFLDLPKVAPRLAAVATGLAIASGALIASVLIKFVPGSFLVFGPLMLGCFFALVLVAQVRHPVAPISYMLSMVSILGAVLLSVAWIRGVLAEPPYADLVVTGALCASSLLLSHALYVDLTRARIVRASDRFRVRELARMEKERLELAVAERTEELAKAVAVAEAASRAKSDFLATVSHELRTPLHTMLGQLQLLERQDQTVAHRATLARRSGEHLLALINDLLIYTRGEANQPLIDKGPVDLAELARSLAMSGRMLAEPKGLNFVSEVSAHPPGAVLADRQHLAQVLLNLIDNACKYTEQGRVVFRLECQPAEDGERDDLSARWYRVRFEVEDTGIGVAPEDRQRIFEPFCQLRPTSVAKGMGMGLAIACRLVKAMGGELRLSGAPGKGSLFWFDLRVRGLRPSELGPAYLVRQGPITGHMPPQRQVLIVDDTEENRCVLGDALRLWGFRVLEADNGQSALDICAAQGKALDLVVIDQYMPELDGWAFLARARRLPGLEGLPVVLLSAAEPRCPEAVGGDFAFNGFLIKPFRLEDLEDLLGRLLHIEWLREARVPGPDEP